MDAMMDAREGGRGGAILMRCAACGQRLRTGTHNLGGFVRCSRCSHKFLVPTTAAAGRLNRLERSRVEEAALDRPAARREIRDLLRARQRRLERIGAAAQAAGEVPPALAATLGEVLGALQARVDCFNALRETGASRQVLESVRESLARLAAERDRVLVELGRQLVAAGTAPSDQVRTIRHLESRIGDLQSQLGRRPSRMLTARPMIVLGLMATRKSCSRAGWYLAEAFRRMRTASWHTGPHEECGSAVLPGADR